jgi:hypothetical protein
VDVLLISCPTCIVPEKHGWHKDTTAVVAEGIVLDGNYAAHYYTRYVEIVSSSSSSSSSSATSAVLAAPTTVHLFLVAAGKQQQSRPQMPLHQQQQRNSNSNSNARCSSTPHWTSSAWDSKGSCW